MTKCFEPSAILMYTLGKYYKMLSWPMVTMVTKKIYTFDPILNIETILEPDLILSFFARIIGVVFKDYLYALELGAAFLFFIGLTRYLASICKTSLPHVITLSGFFCLSIFLIAHGSLLFSLLYPLALLLMVFQAFTQDKVSWKRVRNIFLIAGVCYLFWISGPLAFVFSIICVLTFDRLSNILKWRVTLFALICSFVRSLGLNVFDFPDAARFSEVSSFAYVGAVFFGEERMPFTAHYVPFVKENSISILLGVIFSASILPELIRAGSGKSFRVVTQSYQVRMLFILLLMLVTSFLFLESSFLYVASPEAMLYKIIPGLVWRFSASLVPALLWIFIFINFVRHIQVQNAKLSFFYLVTTISLLFFVYSGRRPINELVYLDHTVKIPVHLSPSLGVLKLYGYDDSVLSSLHSRYRNVFDKERSCAVTTSRTKEDAALIFDGKAKTIWHTRGNQVPGDFVQITCNAPILFDRVRVVVPSSDFPRGFKVEAQIDNEYRLISEFTPWNGAIELSPMGYPYFSSQGEVIVYVIDQTQTNSVRITLTEGDALFDWSVAEVVFEVKE